MFNSTIYKNESKVVAVTKEIEKTISPDKVTEMYDAVREQVIKDIIDVVRVESNQFHGVLIVMNDMFNVVEFNYKAKFTLNGQEIYTEGILDKEMVMKQSYNEVFNKFYDSYRDILAKKLIQETVKVIPTWNRN